MTRETVFFETFARRATSLIVARRRRSPSVVVWPRMPLRPIMLRDPSPSISHSLGEPPSKTCAKRCWSISARGRPNGFASELAVRSKAHHSVLARENIVNSRGGAGAHPIALLQRTAAFGEVLEQKAQGRRGAAPDGGRGALSDA